MKKFLVIEILIKNSQKNFGQHLLKNCCATKVFMKIYIFFLPNFGGRSKWKILNVKKLSWVQHMWFLSTLTSLESIKKNWWTFGQQAQTESRQKKISWNFWQFFLILHGLQCACYTLWNVAIFFENVVYDANNKIWQYYFVANKIRNFLFMMKILKKC